MKFIDKIIETQPDNRIHWLWTPRISLYSKCLDISYKNAIIKYYKPSNIASDIIQYYNKKNDILHYLYLCFRY